MTILEKIKFEEDWLSEVNLTKENIKIAFAGIRATVLEQQTSEDCVSRAELLKAFETECAEECGCCDKHRDNGMSFFGNYKSWCGLIAEFPPVTPQPKIGRWIDIWDKNDYSISTQGRCNRCEQVSDRPLGNFCKWCGAKMEVEE